MSQEMVMSIIKDAIQTGLTIAAPILLVSLVLGLLISILQATTQIQEQTLTFVPKLIAVAIVGVLTGPWMLQKLISFITRIFDLIANVTH
ncbi:MAG: flagellar biosynthesis protein FliQ [Bacillota bacterium]|nr:flagellar biosynthesis protein FliQ [Bacillota bacterium]